MKLRIIGDIHGESAVFNKISQSLHKYDLSVQVGDCGIGFARHKQTKLPEEYLQTMPSDKFKIIAGNHDNHEVLLSFPHYLGRFGTFEFANKLFFFVSGACSTDIEQRTEGFDWWRHEELNYLEYLECLNLWDKVHRKVFAVLSHDCPMMVSHALGLSYEAGKTSTRQLLSQLYDIHEPPNWFFGHHHQSKTIKHRETVFRCLNINEELVLEF